MRRRDAAAAVAPAQVHLRRGSHRAGEYFAASPSTAFSGLRSSWLMRAMKRDLAARAMAW